MKNLCRNLFTIFVTNPKKAWSFDSKNFFRSSSPKQPAKSVLWSEQQNYKFTQIMHAWQSTPTLTWCKCQSNPNTDYLFMFVYISELWFACLFIASECKTFYSFCQFVKFSVCPVLSVFLSLFSFLFSVSFSIWLYVFLHVVLSMCQLVWLSVCLSICISVCCI